MMLRRHPRLRRSIDHFSFDELLRLSKCEFAGISGAKGREDLASLAKLTALRLLQLWNTKVSDVAPLAELTALQVLSLKGTRVSDLVPISTLTALQSLSLMGTDVTDLAPITDRRAGHGMLLSLVRVENPQSSDRARSLVPYVTVSKFAHATYGASGLIQWRRRDSPDRHPEQKRRCALRT